MIFAELASYFMQCGIATDTETNELKLDFYALLKISFPWVQPKQIPRYLPVSGVYTVQKYGIRILSLTCLLILIF